VIEAGAILRGVLLAHSSISAAGDRLSLLSQQLLRKAMPLISSVLLRTSGKIFPEHLLISPTINSLGGKRA
jgi:hypothetical protein